MSDSTMVTISMDEYLALLDSQFMLDCLQNYGVDNWEGYDGAMEDYNTDEDD